MSALEKGNIINFSEWIVMQTQGDCESPDSESHPIPN